MPYSATQSTKLFIGEHVCMSTRFYSVLKSFCRTMIVSQHHAIRLPSNSISPDYLLTDSSTFIFSSAPNYYITVS